MNAKPLILGMASTLGGTQVIRAFRAALRCPGRAFVLMYHRVSPEPSYLGLTVPPALFEKQIRLLYRRTRIMSMRALVDRLGESEPLAEDIAAVTFDDGYRDNLELAEPILARYGVPATVFVTTNFIDGTDIPVWDRLQHTMRCLWRQNIPPNRWPGIGDDKTDGAVRRTLAHTGDMEELSALATAFRNLEPRQREDVVQELARLGASPPAGSPMLSWDEVRTLANRGVEIGSHTVSHPALSRLTAEDVDRELRASKERIEAQINRPVVGFAFPYGNRSDFTDANLLPVKHAGYRYACTAVRGSNWPGDDPLRIRRIGLSYHPASLLDIKLALSGPPEPAVILRTYSSQIVHLHRGRTSSKLGRRHAWRLLGI